MRDNTSAPHLQVCSHIQRGLVMKVIRIVKQLTLTIVHMPLVEGGVVVEIGRGGGREALSVYGSCGLK